MPVYEYACDTCRVKKDKLWSRISVAKDTIPCPECGKDMRRLVSAAAFTFAHKTGMRGALPPSTGTSDDWKVDKIIGRDAEKRWETVEARESHKQDQIRQERKAGKLVNSDQLVRTTDGYRTITEPERVRTNLNRDAAHKITTEISNKIRTEDAKVREHAKKT